MEKEAISEDRKREEQNESQALTVAKKMMKKMKEENVEVKKKDVCGNCKKDLKRSDHLRRHVKSVHEGDEEGCSEMDKEKEGTVSYTHLTLPTKA